MKKERVDVLSVKQGLFETREQAKRAIMAGLVYDSHNERLDKPGEKIAETMELHAKAGGLKYVSRGGLKLEKAVQLFDLSMQDKILLDIGASTGGFTDVALQNGARLSYALDVGYNQLAWKIRQDPRVIVMERTNFRYSVPADFQAGIPDIATIDVSFISLKLILPVLKTILRANGDVVALIKPQFEAGREAVGKKGVVRDPEVHLQVLTDIVLFMQNEGYTPLDISYSPITGGEGNIEYLVHAKWQPANLLTTKEIVPADLKEIVKEAHQTLKK